MLRTLAVHIEHLLLFGELLLKHKFAPDLFFSFKIMSENVFLFSEPRESSNNKQDGLDNLVSKHCNIKLLVVLDVLHVLLLSNNFEVEWLVVVKVFVNNFHVFAFNFL